MINKIRFIECGCLIAYGVNNTNWSPYGMNYTDNLDEMDQIR